MQTKNRTSRLRLPLGSLILVLLLIVSSVFGGYYFKKYRDLKALTSKSADQANTELLAEVSKVYELPKDEKPVVALVSDENTFKKEYPVFTSAKLGDNLLLYEKAGQAILYRPSDKKVIGTASFAVKRAVTIGLLASAAEQASTEKVLADKLKDAVKVGNKAVASGVYSTTQVIDISGKQAAAAKTIAEALGGTVVASLPSNEKAPEGSEIVVIVANKADQPTVQPTNP